MGDTRNGTNPKISLIRVGSTRLVVPTKRIRRALFAQPHFWLTLITLVMGQVVTWQLPDTVHRLALFIVEALGALGYTAGALWSPPREPWSPEQRAQAKKEDQ